MFRKRSSYTEQRRAQRHRLLHEEQQQTDQNNSAFHFNEEVGTFFRLPPVLSPRPLTSRPRSRYPIWLLSVMKTQWSEKLHANLVFIQNRPYPTFVPLSSPHDISVFDQLVYTLPRECCIQTNVLRVVLSVLAGGANNKTTTEAAILSFVAFFFFGGV